MDSSMSAHPTSQRHGATTTRLLLAANRVIYRVSRHWLLLLNLVAAPFALLPIIAPVAAAAGFGRLSALIYAIFAPICHQLDDRSFHLAGHKFACCERCFAIYSGLFVLGAGYAVVRWRLPPASLTLASLLSVPVLIDVFSQPALQRKSTWQVRTITGLLFALAVTWFVLPRLETGFGEISRQIEKRFSRLVAEGLTRPLRRVTAIRTTPADL